jgi:hypothetical protein
MQAEIDEFMAQAYDEALKETGKEKVKEANPPYVIDSDAGTITVSFKAKASGKREDGSPWKFRPAMFDAKGDSVDPDEMRVGTDSVLRASYTPRTFYTALVGAGVSLRLQATQLLKLVEFQATAASHGFEKEDAYINPDDAQDEQPF